MDVEQVGYSLVVIEPGQRGAQYHRELDNQEDAYRALPRRQPGSPAV